MKLNLKIFFNFIVILSFICGTKASKADQSSSLNWQKAELESRLKADIINNLSATIGKENFVINIDLVYKAPEVKAPEEKKAAPGQNNQNNESLSEEDKQLLFLNKLGMQAPVIVEKEESKVEPKQETPEVVDIFSLIEKVRVTCLLDDSIPEDRALVVKKIISNSLMQFDPKKLTVSLDKVKLFLPKVDKAAEEKAKFEKEEREKDRAEKARIEKETKQKEIEREKKEAEMAWIKKFEPFSTPVSIFLSFVTVMAMMLVLFKSTTKSISPAANTPAPAPQESTKAEPEPETPQSAPQNYAGSESVGPRSQGDSVPTEEINLTMDKFKLFLKSSPIKCRLIIQEWIATEGSLTTAAIKTLALYLSLDQFNELTGHFTAEQKKKLKKIMSTQQDDAPAITEVLSFLRGQMMVAYLSDDVELADNQKSFIASLNAIELGELAADDLDMVAGAVNLVSPETVAQLFNHIETEKVGQILQKTSQFKFENFVGTFDSFEAKIKNIREKSKVVLAPVLDGAESLLEQVGPEKESLLFTALIDSKAYALVEKLSKKYFPSELIFKFSPDQLKIILLKLSIANRAELIFSMSEEDRKPIFAALGETGKMRELIDSEIESIQVDEARKKSIERNKAAIRKSFVDLVRNTAKTNPLIQESADTLVKTWLDEKKNGSSPNAQAA